MSGSLMVPRRPEPLRAVAAVALGLHGIVHLLGFSSTWRLQHDAELPATTLIANGTIDVGEVGIRIVGLLWVVAAVALLAAAALVWRRSPRAAVGVAIATTISLAACLLGLPAAVLGVWIDLAIVVVLMLAESRTAGTAR
jgi:hypothetical protein